VIFRRWYFPNTHTCRAVDTMCVCVCVCWYGGVPTAESHTKMPKLW